jgi:hypothetical protein
VKRVDVAARGVNRSAVARHAPDDIAADNFHRRYAHHFDTCPFLESAVTSRPAHLARSSCERPVKVLGRSLEAMNNLHSRPKWCARPEVSKLSGCCGECRRSEVRQKLRRNYRRRRQMMQGPDGKGWPSGPWRDATYVSGPGWKGGTTRVLRSWRDVLLSSRVNFVRLLSLWHSAPERQADHWRMGRPRDRLQDRFPEAVRSLDQRVALRACRSQRSRPPRSSGKDQTCRSQR